MTATSIPPASTANVMKVGRKRRSLGWTLLVLGVVMAGVWVWSGWWRVSWCSASWRLTLQRGQVYAERFGDGFGYTGVRTAFIADELTGLYNWSAAPPLEATGSFSVQGRRLWVCSYANRYFVDAGKPVYERWCLAYWFVPLALWACGAVCLRSGVVARRRVLAGACAACGYDRAGIACGAPCPECGKGGRLEVVRALRRKGRRRRALGWTLLACGAMVAGAWGVSGWERYSGIFAGALFSLENGELTVKFADSAIELEEERSFPGLTEDLHGGPAPVVRTPLLRRWRWRTTQPDPRWTANALNVHVASFEQSRGSRLAPPTTTLTGIVWPVPVVLWALGVLLLRSGIVAWRRAVRGTCTSCGYDLSGLPAGEAVKCPECGKVERDPLKLKR